MIYEQLRLFLIEDSRSPQKVLFSAGHMVGHCLELPLVNPT